MRGKIIGKSAFMNTLAATCDGLMEVVKLAYLVEREGGWKTEKNWGTILSLGEQQRMSMARLFFHRYGPSPGLFWGLLLAEECWAPQCTERRVAVVGWSDICPSLGLLSECSRNTRTFWNLPSATAQQLHMSSTRASCRLCGCVLLCAACLCACWYCQVHRT